MEKRTTLASSDSMEHRSALGKLPWLMFALVSAGLIWLLWDYYRGAAESKAATEVYMAFVPLTAALDTYQKQMGTAAPDLAALTPHYLQQMPASERIQSVNYRVSQDGMHWELTLHGGALKAHRAYLARSLSEPPQQGGVGFVGIFHGWAVFRE